MSWFAEHGFTLLQSIGIIAGLVFTGVQLQRDATARRVENQLAITRSHREIWRAFSDNPALARVLDDEVDLEAHPITEAERIFVLSAILHLNATFTAYRAGMAPIPEGLLDDIRSFFGKPIANAVWQETRHLRDLAFRHLVDSLILDKPERP